MYSCNVSENNKIKKKPIFSWKNYDYNSKIITDHNLNVNLK